MRVVTSSKKLLLILICLGGPGHAMAEPLGDRCGELLHKVIVQNPRVDASDINPNKFIIGSSTSGIRHNSEGITIQAKWAGSETWTECFHGVGYNKPIKCGDLFYIGDGPDPNESSAIRLISNVNQQQAWARSINEHMTECRLTDKEEGIPQYETALHLYDTSTGHKMGRRFPMRYSWTAQYKIDGVGKIFDLKLIYDGFTRWFPDRPIF